jgi:hypothetical protein
VAIIDDFCAEAHIVLDELFCEVLRTTVGGLRNIRFRTAVRNCSGGLKAVSQGQILLKMHNRINHE